MVAKAFGHQHHTHHHQKAQGQHFDGGVRIDKLANGFGEQHHQGQGNDHSRDHDAHIVHHTHRGDDRVEGEHQIDQHDLHDDGHEADFGFDISGRLVAFQGVVNLARAFPDEEQASNQQNQVSA